MKTIKQVEEFHQAFGHPIESHINIGDEKLNALRVRLLAEEVEELKVALQENNPTEVLDALLDIQYVLDGAVLALGFKDVFDEAFHQVHQSNMSKLGEDGKPVYDEGGKVLKGPNYFKVDLTQYIDRLEWRKQNSKG